MTGVSKKQTDLETLYQEELKQFEDALTISEKMLAEADGLSIEQISEHVAFRESIIDTIKSIESDIRSWSRESGHVLKERYGKRIAPLAKKLVEIDSKIYKILQGKKLKLVQNYSKTASDSIYSRQKAIDQEKTSKIVDIRQK